MKINILGVNIDSVSLNEAADLVVEMTKDGKKHYVVTPNPEMVVLAQKDAEFRTTLNNADLAIADGVGLVWASKVKGESQRGKSLSSRVTGVDLVEVLCKKAAGMGLAVGFLGGKEGVVKLASEKLKVKYPGFKVAFALSSDPEKALDDILRLTPGVKQAAPYHTPGVFSNVVAATRKKWSVVSGQLLIIDFLFVAYGAPKQEKWMAAHLNSVPAKVFIGVGGAFDYISGKLPRAPKFVRQTGLEWLWRLVRQPWRFKRQLALLRFIWLMLSQSRKSKSK